MNQIGKKRITLESSLSNETYSAKPRGEIEILPMPLAEVSCHTLAWFPIQPSLFDVARSADIGTWKTRRTCKDGLVEQR